MIMVIQLLLSGMFLASKTTLGRFFLLEKNLQVWNIALFNVQSNCPFGNGQDIGNKVKMVVKMYTVRHFNRRRDVPWKILAATLFLPIVPPG